MEISKRNHPFWVFGAWRKSRGQGGHLLCWGSALANFKSPGSQMAGGARGRLPRAASIERSPRAGQAPPASVHAYRNCGTWRADAGRERRALGVRSPKCCSWVDATVCAQTGDSGRAPRRQGDSK